MSSNKPPAKENNTAGNDAVSSNLRPRNNNTNTAKEKPTDRINRDLQLSNNNGRTRSRRSRSSTSSCSIAKKMKSVDDTLSIPSNNNVAWVEFPLGPGGHTKTVYVPEEHAAGWQEIVNNSKKPYASLNFLSTRSFRILNGGSPPMILDALMLDDSISNVCLLQETSLRRSKQDRGFVVVGLPAILRSLPLFQSKVWKDATDGAICTRWNKMMNLFKVDISPASSSSGKDDLMKQVFYYRSSSFFRGNSTAISAMVGNIDNWTTLGRPLCKHPGGCTNEAHEQGGRGFCLKHLPKKCPFCDKNKVGNNATFECTRCYGRRHNKVYVGGKLLSKKELQKRGIWNPNPGTLTKELAQKEAKKVAKK